MLRPPRKSIPTETRRPVQRMRRYSQKCVFQSLAKKVKVIDAKPKRFVFRLYQNDIRSPWRSGWFHYTMADHFVDFAIDQSKCRNGRRRRACRPIGRCSLVSFLCSTNLSVQYRVFLSRWCFGDETAKLLPAFAVHSLCLRVTLSSACQWPLSLRLWRLRAAPKRVLRSVLRPLFGWYAALQALSLSSKSNFPFWH